MMAAMARMEPALSEGVRNVMRANGHKDTGPERLVRTALAKMGVSGFRMNYRRAKGRPDVAFPEERIAVFINGCFWHRCPKCSRGWPVHNAEYWREKLLENQRRDVRTRAALRAEGWKVITLWECDVRRNATRCALRVARAVGKRRLP